jgi:hypothetical protein
MVKTPLGVIKPPGTIFEVEASLKSLKVKVLKGKVMIYNKIKGRSIITSTEYVYAQQNNNTKKQRVLIYLKRGSQVLNAIILKRDKERILVKTNFIKMPFWVDIKDIKEIRTIGDKR